MKNIIRLTFIITSVFLMAACSSNKTKEVSITIEETLSQAIKDGNFQEAISLAEAAEDNDLTNILTKENNKELLISTLKAALNIQQNNKNLQDKQVIISYSEESDNLKKFDLINQKVAEYYLSSVNNLILNFDYKTIAELQSKGSFVIGVIESDQYDKLVDLEKVSKAIYYIDKKEYKKAVEYGILSNQEGSYTKQVGALLEAKAYDLQGNKEDAFTILKNNSFSNLPPEFLDDLQLLKHKYDTAVSKLEQEEASMKRAIDFGYEVKIGMSKENVRKEIGDPSEISENEFYTIWSYGYTMILYFNQNGELVEISDL